MKIGLFFSRSDGAIDKAVDINSLSKYFGQEYHTFIVEGTTLITRSLPGSPAGQA